jgi:periplasmic copper chaperone A
MIRALLMTAALLSAAPALAHEARLGDLQIIHPAIPMRPGQTAAGYMTIHNHGTAPDSLIAITSTVAARTELHESRVSADGIATMGPVAILEIPAGGTVEMQPGGLHIMFMGLETPLAEGAMLPVTLSFERAGEVTVDFMVEPPKAGATEDHSHHGHEVTQ